MVPFAGCWHKAILNRRTSHINWLLAELFFVCLCVCFTCGWRCAKKEHEKWLRAKIKFRLNNTNSRKQYDFRSDSSRSLDFELLTKFYKFKSPFRQFFFRVKLKQTNPFHWPIVPWPTWFIFKFKTLWLFYSACFNYIIH